MLVGLVLLVVGLVLAYGVRRTPTLTILAAAAAPELWCITHHSPHPRLLRLGCHRCTGEYCRKRSAGGT